MGLRNLPLTPFTQNRIWCQIVASASELTGWMGLLGYAGQSVRKWEPKRLRHRSFQIPATIARHARQQVLHLSDRSIWAGIVQAGYARLAQLPAPAGLPQRIVTDHPPKDHWHWAPDHRDRHAADRHTPMPKSTRKHRQRRRPPWVSSPMKYRG